MFHVSHVCVCVCVCVCVSKREREYEYATEGERQNVFKQKVGKKGVTVCVREKKSLCMCTV